MTPLPSPFDHMTLYANLLEQDPPAFDGDFIRRRAG